MNFLKNVKLLDFKKIQSEDSSLFVYENDVQFFLHSKRTFVIKSKKAAQRGRHAHKECAQLLVCLEGRCLVTVDDGSERTSHNLNHPDQGLFIPPGVWAEQDYSKNTILMVLTDQSYDEGDYIRDYDKFLSFRRTYEVSS